MLDPDSKVVKWGLFVFSALGGIGGLACTLQYLDVKPSDLHINPTFPHVAWLLIGLVLFAVSLYTSFKALRLSVKPSKLKIYSANYAAEDGGGKRYEVDEFLRKIVVGDSLVLDVESHNFALLGKNYVPLDPKPGSRKRLQVTFSYDGGIAQTIERLEHYRLVLPEDTYVNESLTNLLAQLATTHPSVVSDALSDSDPLVYPEFTDARWTSVSDNKELQAYFSMENRSTSEARAVILEPIEMDGKVVQFTRHRIAEPLLPKHGVAFYPDVVTRDNKSVSDREKDLFHLFCLDYLALKDMRLIEATKSVRATYQDSKGNLFEVTCELVFDPAAHGEVRTGVPAYRGSSPVIFTRNHRFRKIASALA